MLKVYIRFKQIRDVFPYKVNVPDREGDEKRWPKP
jgi:hypothetical protein